MKKTFVTRLLAILVCVATLATVTPIFAAAETTITEITITDADITAVIGDKVGDHLAYTLPENRHFTVDGHYWFDESAYKELDDAAAFAADGLYDTCWLLKADTGYTFDENATVTINGQTDIVDPKYTEIDDEDNTIFYVWTNGAKAVEKPAATVIDKIEILDADVTPYIGEKAGDWLDYTLQENCHFTIQDHYWYNETVGRSMTSGDVFAAGLEYDLCWVFKADSGYTFDEIATITINGQTDIVDPNYTEIDDEDNTIFYVWTKPTEAVEKPANVIDKIEITDVDLLPIIGEKTNDHIDYTFSENCHFTAEEHGWYDKTDWKWVDGADDTFVAGHIYQVGWWLDADEGYTFAEDPTITINGGENINWGDTYIDEANSMRFFVWTESKEAVELTVIDKIEINDADVTPYIGEKAGDWLDCTLPENCHFTVDDHYWYNETDGKSLIATDTFEADISYEVGWWLIADEGYVFAENPTITINGQTDIDWEYTYRGDTVYTNGEHLFFVWTKADKAVEKPAANVINKIEINGFCDAVVGGKASDFIHLTLPEDAPYHIKEDSPCWEQNNSGAFLEDDDVFEAGKSYTLGCTLIADAGYIFAEDAEVLLNGGDVGVDEKYTKTDSEDAGIFYVWSEPREAVEVTPAETVVDLRIGDKEFYGVKGGETFEVESLDVVEDITVLTQNGVDIEGMSEDWSMSTKFLDSEGRGVLEVQVFDEGDGYVTFNLQSHYADCPGAAVDDFQIMLITLKLPTGEKMLGDANDDGAVNMKDVLVLRKQLAGMSPEINMTNADCNGDGDVNMKDVLLLRKFLAGLITELGA